jgi:hypothetical protein
METGETTIATDQDYLWFLYRIQQGNFEKMASLASDQMSQIQSTVNLLVGACGAELEREEESERSDEDLIYQGGVFI